MYIHTRLMFWLGSAKNSCQSCNTGLSVAQHLGPPILYFVLVYHDAFPRSAALEIHSTLRTCLEPPESRSILQNYMLVRLLFAQAACHDIAFAKLAADGSAPPTVPSSSELSVR